MRIEIEGSKELQAALARASDDIREAVSQEVHATGIEIQSEIVRRIQRGPASGRTYQKYNPRRMHTASAPGQAPMSDTGRLAASVNGGLRRTGDMSVSVGSNLVYALHLEYGTRKMAARPVWVPVAEKTGPAFRKRLEAIIAGAIK